MFSSESSRVSAGRAAVRRLWALSAVTGVCDFVFGATFIFVMQQQGIDAGVIGGLFAATVVISRVVEIPSGAIGDCYGHRTVMAWGLILWGGGLVLFGVAADATWFGAALLAWSAGMAAFSGAPTALVVNELRAGGAEAEVQRALRGGQVLRWVYSAVGAGTVALGGGVIPPRHLIAVAGIVLVATAVWVRFTWTQNRPERSLSVAGSLWQGVRLLAGDELRRLLSLTAVSAAVLSLLIMSWQPILADLGGFSARSLGLVLLTMTLGSALGAWAARVPGSRDPEVFAAGSLCALVLTIELVGRGLAATLVALVVAEFFVGMAGVFLNLQLHEAVPDQLRNTTTSLFSTATGLAMGLADLAFGFLWHHLGPAEALHTGGRALLAVLVVHLVLYAVGRRRHRPADVPASTGTVG